MKLQTRVAIVGGGPAGMLLSHMLHCRGVESVVIERRGKEYVLQRIRAGVLEQGSVELLRAEELGERLGREGIPHDTTVMAKGGECFDLDTKQFVGKPMTAYGQTAITEDLYRRREEDGAVMFHEAEEVSPRDLLSEKPRVTFVHNNEEVEVECDFVAGCDGYHGVCRQCIPQNERAEYVKTYPFGWLGILSRTPPLKDLLYTSGEDGFALCSKRNPMLSRYYVQCPMSDSVDDWPDDRFWQTLKSRCPPHYAEQIVTGDSVEKSIAPLRGFICEPMQWGRLFLAGDAGHIVPPTGAKGLNLAISDVFYLNRALNEFYKNNNEAPLQSYSETALRRVWAVSRFSWWLTNLLHVFPQQPAMESRFKETEFAHIAKSERAQMAMAEQYAGLPY